MKTWKTAGIICSAILILAVSLAACSQKPGQGITYDPSKNYAAFLVINNAIGKNVLESMKKHSLEEQFVIGPIEYYEPGAKDFESILRRLTVSKQVKLVWIISSVWDVADIKAAMTKIDYKGPYRYAPLTDQTGALKIQQ
jgi:hypothetical protein